MGLAAPGNVLHWLSMHLCLVRQSQPCHTYWHQSSRIRPCLSMPSLLSNAWKFVINLLQDVARCTWPYHLSYRQQMTDVISSMPNFCSRDAEGVSSLSLMPQMQRLMAWASCQIRKIAGCACAGNAGNVFPRHRLQRKLLVSDPGMHHGTCVTHVPWCMSGSLTRGGGENVPGIPGACAPAIIRIW